MKHIKCVADILNIFVFTDITDLDEITKDSRALQTKIKAKNSTNILILFSSFSLFNFRQISKFPFVNGLVSLLHNNSKLYQSLAKDRYCELLKE